MNTNLANGNNKVWNNIQQRIINKTMVAINAKILMI